jgi:hypothetical protein
MVWGFCEKFCTSCGGRGDQICVPWQHCRKIVFYPRFFRIVFDSEYSQFRFFGIFLLCISIFCLYLLIFILYFFIPLKKWRIGGAKFWSTSSHDKSSRMRYTSGLEGTPCAALLARWFASCSALAWPCVSLRGACSCVTRRDLKS